MDARSHCGLLDVAKRAFRASVEGSAISGREFSLDAMTSADLDELFAREFTTIITANSLDLAMIAHIGQELFELCWCLGLILDEVDPRETGQVVTDDQGVFNTSDPGYGLFPAEVDEDSLQLTC